MSPTPSGTITLNPSSPAPQYGGLVIFDWTAAHVPGSDPIGIELEAFQPDFNGARVLATVLYGTAQPGNNSGKLTSPATMQLAGTGSSNDWNDNGGGQASCRATLVYSDSHDGSVMPIDAAVVEFVAAA